MVRRFSKFCRVEVRGMNYYANLCFFGIKFKPADHDLQCNVPPAQATKINTKIIAAKRAVCATTMPFSRLRADYEQCGDDVVDALKTGDAACADTAPPEIKVKISVVFDGKFEDIVGAAKTTFLDECSKSLSSNDREVACVDVRPGSVIVDVRGSTDALDAAGAELEAKGLTLPSFKSLKAGVVYRLFTFPDMPLFCIEILLRALGGNWYRSRIRVAMC